MRCDATDQSPEETARYSQHKHIQRRALRAAKTFARIRRDIEVRHNVAEESAERARSEDEEETVMER